MLRISDVLDFDIKIISERFSFKEDELLKILGEIRNGVDDIKKNSVACCKETNKNLTALLEQMKKCCDKKKEVVPEPKPEEPEEPEEPKPEEPTPEPEEPEDPKEFVCKPMTLKVENGKFVADVPEEYKELCLFVNFGDGFDFYSADTCPAGIDYILAQLNDDGSISGCSFILAYKPKKDDYCTLDDFECLSNEVVYEKDEKPKPNELEVYFDNIDGRFEGVVASIVKGSVKTVMLDVFAELNGGYAIVDVLGETYKVGDKVPTPIRLTTDLEDFTFSFYFFEAGEGSFATLSLLPEGYAVKPPSKIDISK